MELPEPVRQVCDDFLTVAPDDLVTGLHLCGGLAFGEWIPGRSDVDFVATLARRPSAYDIKALRNAHEVVGAKYPDLAFDGMHVLAADLARDPASLPPCPVVLAGRFDPEGRLDPEVAWAELAACGVTVAGPALTTSDLWHSPDGLRSFTLVNLATYWRATATELAASPDEALERVSGGVSDDTCSWCVLGVARLDHLLVTGELTTKSRAGRWGLDHYPARFHRVLREALRIRDGGPPQYAATTGARRDDVADFTAHVVDSAPTE